MKMTKGLTVRKGLLALGVMVLLLGLASVAGAATYGRYDFIFYYNQGSGDQYKGYFYADTALGYKIGSQKVIAADENAQKGYYVIKTASTLTDGSSFNKQVFVTTYFDFEEKKWLTPLNYTKPQGTNSWGSETGFIISDSDPTYRFGQYGTTFYEADIIADAKYNGFTFKYSFGGGDWYTGMVYAPVNQYFVGWTSYVRDENNDVGFYEVTGRTTGAYDPARNGQVWVENYYDAESKKYFKPLKFGLGQAAGTGYLTSESDHIKQVHNQYNFGRGRVEADVTNRYYFTYTFENGDYYKGYLYAGGNYNYNEYFTGYTRAVRDEHGQWGAYNISNTYYDYDVSLNGQVFVYSYYDKESNKGFIPLKFPTRTPAGTNYLDSETDYILKNLNQYMFGRGYYEADVTNKYFYTYTFADGDKYEGYFYGPSNYYYVGYKTSAIKDEKGKFGYYVFTDMVYNFDAALNGQVYITKYYDVESNRNYTPFYPTAVKGTSYLTSEIGYIIKEKDNQYRFGQGYYEADVTMRYYYTYKFANGDYYQGYGYAPTDYNHNEYYVGYTRSVRDEHGKWGRYVITSIAYGYLTPTGTWVNFNNLYNAKVYAYRYYVGDSKLTLPTVSPSGVKGTGYLGSERGYIIEAGVTQYYFGGGYYKADLTSRYAFTYTYGDGEWYSGWFYDIAKPDLYRLNQIVRWVKDETGLWGNYRITAVTVNQNYRNNGKVMVNQYYYKNGLAHSPGIYVPFKYLTNTYAGTGGIGSERDYIIVSNNSKYYFGGGYYKVDVGL